MTARPFEIGRFLRAVDEGRARTGRASVLGSTLLCLDRTSSTQDAARRLLDAGAPHGTAVLAEEQLEGRGRRGRAWLSPSGAGLYVTLVLRRGFEPGHEALLTIAAALAAHDAARDAGARSVEIKWPNDLIARGRKVGGVLGELVPMGGAAGGARGHPVALLGLGLNVEPLPSPPAAAMNGEATWLRAEGLTREIGREELLAAVLGKLEEALEPLASGGREEILERWRRASPSSIGHRAVVGEPGDDGASPPAAALHRGTTQGIDEEGALRLEDEQGRILVFRHGATLRLEETDPRGSGAPSDGSGRD